MKTPGPVSLISALGLALCLAALLAGCAGPSANRLTYAQVQSLNPGVSASWILNEFPQGRVTRGPDGKVQSIAYNVKDPRGSGQSLQLVFNGDEILCQKRYSGANVRPGGSHSQPASR